jgi:hypothetical protein
MHDANTYASPPLSTNSQRASDSCADRARQRHAFEQRNSASRRTLTGRKTAENDGGASPPHPRRPPAIRQRNSAPPADVLAFSAVQRRPQGDGSGRAFGRQLHRSRPGCLARQLSTSWRSHRRHRPAPMSTTGLGKSPCRVRYVLIARRVLRPSMSAITCASMRSFGSTLATLRP